MPVVIQTVRVDVRVDVVAVAVQMLMATRRLGGRLRDEIVMVALRLIELDVFVGVR